MRPLLLLFGCCFHAFFFACTQAFLLRRPTDASFSSANGIILECSKKDNDKESSAPSSSGSSADLSWLRDAMNTPSVPPDGLLVVPAREGVSGFAVDPQRGFVVVVVGGDRAGYSVVSPKDTQQVRSPEALCLVQLAGGLDLGTPVLPPDLLATLVAEELGSTTTASAKEIRYQVELDRVDVVPNDDVEGNGANEFSLSEAVNNASSTPERDEKIEQQAPKVASAVNNLPGLEECTLDQVTEAIRIHADSNGEIDRAAFTALLDTLRKTVNAMEISRIKFILQVSLLDGNQKISITAPSTLAAVGLALRYKANVVLSEECQREGFDVVEIASRFPFFRPVQELEEDASIMDGFIPSMFSKATAPKNDDKA